MAAVEARPHQRRVGQPQRQPLSCASLQQPSATPHPSKTRAVSAASSFRNNALYPVMVEKATAGTAALRSAGAPARRHQRLSNRGPRLTFSRSAAADVEPDPTGGGIAAVNSRAVTPSEGVLRTEPQHRGRSTDGTVVRSRSAGRTRRPRHSSKGTSPVMLTPEADLAGSEMVSLTEQDAAAVASSSNATHALQQLQRSEVEVRFAYVRSASLPVPQFAHAVLACALRSGCPPGTDGAYIRMLRRIHTHAEREDPSCALLDRAALHAPHTQLSHAIPPNAPLLPLPPSPPTQTDPIVQLANERAEQLMTACVYGAAEVVRELCASPRLHMYVDQPWGDTGQTALTASSEAGRVDSALLLIDAGAEIDARDADGRTALMVAALQGESGLIEPLLSRAQHPANVFLRADNGWTALMLACAKGQLSWVAALLEHLAQSGASPDALVDLITYEDRQGRSAVSLARENAHSELLALLEARLAELGSGASDA